MIFIFWSFVVGRRSFCRKSKIKAIFVFCLLAFCSLCLPVFSTAEVSPFDVGEELHYTLKIRNATVGWQKAKIIAKKKLSQDEVFHIIIESKSSIWFFKSHHKDTILIGCDDYLPRYIEKEMEENNFQQHIEVEYQQEKDKTIATTTVTSKKKGLEYKGTTTLPPKTSSQLSLVYYLRTLPLKVGDNFTFKTIDGIWEDTIKVKVIKSETVTTPAGKFNTLLVQVTPKHSKPGKKFWFSNDKKRLPVKMELDRLVAYLEKYSSP